MIQKNRPLVAGLAVVLAEFLSFWITKKIVSENGETAMIVVSLAAGVGCTLACLVSNKLSKDRTYVNVIMSDNLEAMKALRDFLAEHHITNVASDTYTRDWNRKTISITAYPETKDESRMIRDYIAGSKLKFKLVVQPG